MLDSIEKLKSNKEAIAAMWSLVDNATSLSAEKYLELKENKASSPASMLPPSKKTVLEIENKDGVS